MLSVLRNGAQSVSSTKTLVTLARGDGIGPEISDAVVSILNAAGARVDFEEVELGERLYKQGVTSGISPSAWDSIRRNRVMLKGPITTPLGSGYKSLNVTLRKTLGLYANVRPVRSFHPFIETRHPGMDVVIIRENEEDTYAGIEHRQTVEVTQCLKLITRPGSERCIRYAFEYAQRNARKRVTCLTKNNIMKLTDGLFATVFREIAAEYPEIETEHMIVDIGTAKLADDPSRFDVVVTPNLYGDIISDVVAEISGSVGLAGSANMGLGCAMFEAVHGSAPDIAGKGVANPSGLLQAAAMMLVHIGQPEVASKVSNAWLRTIEDGIHTGDVYRSDLSRSRVGTREFAHEVIARLGLKPQHLGESVFPRISERMEPPRAASVPIRKTLDGVDVFLHWDEADRSPEVLAGRVAAAEGLALKLKMITNRGVKVWPGGVEETFRTDHWRCRFMVTGEKPMNPVQVPNLLLRLLQSGLDVIKTENLYSFDGKPGYSLGQGE